MSKDAFKVLGKITPRKDGMPRVTGQERYVSDITLPRILHGRIVSSPYAHARVLSVDTRAAEALEAVCLTFTDIPKLRYNERIVTVPWALHKDHTVLADKVRRTGEAVAAVAAETEALAERAVRAVRVEYEPLPVVTDPIEAMQPGAPALYDSVLLGDQELKIERNIACSRDILEGDPARAFAEAEVIVEGTFRTPKIYHAQMETKSVVCRPESDGGITVWPTTQSIHNLRILRGRGFHTSSAGAPQPGDVIDFSGALVKINQDGSVDVATALMDHGGGTLEALARLVAETLCVPLDKVNISPGDTSITVYDVVTRATRGVYAGGGAVPDLGGGQMSSLCQIVGEVLGVPMERISIYSTDSAVTPLAGTTTATRKLYMSGSAVLQAARAVRQTLWGAPPIISRHRPRSWIWRMARCTSPPIRGSACRWPTWRRYARPRGCRSPTSPFSRRRSRSASTRKQARVTSSRTSPLARRRSRWPWIPKPARSRCSRAWPVTTLAARSARRPSRGRFRAPAGRDWAMPCWKISSCAPVGR